jgi:BolA protein
MMTQVHSLGMTAQELEEIFRSSLKASFVSVRDDSGRHAGHKGAGGGGHFHAVIVSDLFSGKAPIDRHRLVYGAVRMPNNPEIHALSLETFSSDEWSERGRK